MKLSRIAAVPTVMTVVATILAPPSHAMPIGNYNVLTNRYTLAEWIWFVSSCIPDRAVDCLRVAGRPIRRYYASYEGQAHLADGRWTLTVDVPDGLRCFNQNLPTHDTYSWDDVTLAGTITSNYDVGCFNGPPGTQSWTFAVTRL